MAGAYTDRPLRIGPYAGTLKAYVGTREGGEAMGRERSSFGFLGYAWVYALLSLLIGPGLGLDSSGAFAETCFNLQIQEICFEPAEVAKLVDPAALRRVFLAKAPAFRASSLSGKQAVEHPQAGALAEKWNKVAASVLKAPGDRADFYRSVIEDMELLPIIKIRIDMRPVVRVSGLPHSPRVLFSAAGMRDLFQLIGDPRLSPDDAEKMADVLNAFLEAQGASSLLGQSFNITPLLVEFMYQLRLIYRELDKQVVVFADEPGGTSPFVDSVGTLYVPTSFFEGFDSTEQELTLVHEAAHLMLPATNLLMKLLANRLQALGPMGQMMGAPEFTQKLREMNVDMEWDVDASVLTHLRSQAELRRRYLALIARSEPGSVRAAIIGFLNHGIETGEWPRTPVRMSLNEFAPLIQAMSLYEGLPDGPEKLEAMTRFFALSLGTLTQREQAFYKPLYQVMLKHFEQKPTEVILRLSLRHKPSEQELLEEGVSGLFKGVLDTWERQ